MYDSTRTVAVLLATLTVVGFGFAPMTAVASPSENTNTAYQLDDSGLSTQADEHGPFPEEICTDLLGLAHEEMPYDMIVWMDDIPNEAQPPGVPWDVITPKSAGAIVVGAAPNQCDVQDPNDPTFDPIQNDDDELAPNGDGDVQQGEEGEVLFIVNGTLDETSEGPSLEGTLGLDLAEQGTIDPQATLNDGEKDYGVSPELQYWSDGTTYFETDVFVFGSRLGVVEDCTGPECTFSTRGLPNFVEYPAIPSHTDEDYDTGDDSGGDSGGADDGENGTDNGTDDGTGGTGTDGDSGGADGADGSESGGDAGGTDGADATDDGEDGDDGTGDDGETGADDADSSGDGDDGQSGDGGDGGQSSDNAENQQQSGQEDDQQAQRAAAADGSGLGVVVAMVVFILGAAAIAPRD